MQWCHTSWIILRLEIDQVITFQWLSDRNTPYVAQVAILTSLEYEFAALSNRHLRDLVLIHTLSEVDIC